MSESIASQAASELKDDWDLQLPEKVSEAQIIDLLAQRIVRLIDKGPEAFFQMMYRLDIAENKLHAVLHNPDVAQDIARLIYNRQVQKIHTRAHYRNAANNDDPELQW